MVANRQLNSQIKGRLGARLENLEAAIHLYDQEIEPKLICSSTSIILETHIGCEPARYESLLQSRLTESEKNHFENLWSNDSATRNFEKRDGYVVIS